VKIVCPDHGIPDCSPLLNGCSRVIEMHRQVCAGCGQSKDDREGWRSTDALWCPKCAWLA